MDASRLRVTRCTNSRFLTEYEQLRKAVMCPICISSFIDPLSLSCGHSFCKECINTALTVKEICPLCSISVNRRKLVDNSASVLDLYIMLTEFVSSLEPIHYNKVTATKVVAKRSAMTPSATTPVEVVSAVATEGPITSAIVEPISEAVFVAAVDPTSILKPGILVNVLPRTWSGINKLGGIGWITRAHYNEGSFVPFEYDVKYVLDSTTDYHIPAAFVEAHKDLDRTSRRSRTTTGASPGPGSAPNSSSKSTKSGSHSNPTSASKAISTSSSKKRKASGTSPTTTMNSSDPPEPMVILTTAVAPSVIDQLGQLSAKYPHVSVATQFGPEVTHVIVTVDRSGVLKKRTMKYMQALVGGLWIVTSSWVEACHAKMKMLPERPYEVIKNSKATRDNAPQRAREHVKKLKLLQLQQSKLIKTNKDADVVSSSSSSSSGSASSMNLFSGCCVLLYGQFPTPGPPRSDVELLLGAGGAQVTCSLETFLQWVEAHSSSAEGETTASSGGSGVEVSAGSSSTKRHLKNNEILIVLCTEEKYKDQLLTELPPSVVSRVNNGRKDVIFVVSPVWAFDCITNYDFMHPKKFNLGWPV